MKTNSVLDRRDFVKTFALFSAVSWVGGKEFQSFWVTEAQAQSTTLIGIFRMSLVDFPALTSDFGSVRLRVTGMPTSFREIIVTRVEGDVFHSVTSICTHQGITVDPYNKTLKALRCPLHGSEYSTDGKVLKGPATAALQKYATTFDGSQTLAIEIPGLGYTAKIAKATNPTNGESRIQLEFPTVTGLKYEIRFRASVEGSDWVQVPFATKADGALTQTVLNGTNQKGTVFVAGAAEFGFFAVIRY